MNKKLIFGALLMVAMVTGITIVQSASAEKDGKVDAKNVIAPVLVEDFTYPDGSLLTANNWTAHSGAGTNPVQTVGSGLTLPGYPSSGIGNSAYMTITGEDVHRAFPVQTAGSVYAGFMVNVAQASTDAAGGYFFHLGPDPIGTTFRGRIFAKKDGSDNVAFGISKATTTTIADINYTPFSYALNTTYLIIVKYTIVAGAMNDTVDLFVSTTTPSTEPAATVSAPDVGASDINPATVALRQGSTTTAPTVVVDGIRIGTSWADIVIGAVAPVQNIIDFNGDGKTDLAVTRNGTGLTALQLRWYYTLNGTSSTFAIDWGLDTDTIVPADYDGDNKTDIAVWRGVSTGQPSNNAFFYILQSQTNTLRIESFGQIGDDPRVVGDYDGDGKDDLAVFRSSAVGQPGIWYYRGSLNNPGGNITYVNWGVGGDKVAPGDYDGDGKFDFVIARPSLTGQNVFWMNQTTAGVSVRIFGPSIFPDVGAIVSNDFDGDGKTDIAIVTGATNPATWYYQPSSGGNFVQILFGDPTVDDLAVGDYDGDGKTDIAIWRNGAFWIRNSSNGAITGGILGTAGDNPVAAFRVN